MDYTTLASSETVARTAAALKERGISEVLTLNTKEEALAKIKELIPAGVTVMNGSSVTLEQIGYIEYLKSGQHPWINPKEKILAEKDPAKQTMLRRQSVVSDYYLGSVHAVAETGEMIIASNTGSQLPHIVFTSPNLIFVVSTQKIVPTFDDAMHRLRDYVVPLEDKHMRELYNIGTTLSKIVIFNHENPVAKRTVRVLFVNEKLGF